MRWPGIAGALASAVMTAGASAADAAPVTVARFLADYDAMEAKARTVAAPPGATAQWPEVLALKDRMIANATAYRGEVDAARAAGKPPRACLPPKGQGSLDLDDLAAAYRALPPSERARSEHDAFFAYMDKHYPCSP